jgi:Protein of unknown function (DUF4197)
MASAADFKKERTMFDHQLPASSRRGLLAGVGATGLLALTGCATIRHNALTSAIRKLLRESAQRAIARLTGPDGVWARQIEHFDLPGRLGRGGALLGELLTSPQTRDQLDDLLNRLAEQATNRAVPHLVYAVEQIGIPNAKKLLEGGPTAATQFLHSQVGQHLIEEMIPGLADAVRIGRDPLLGPALGLLTGVDVAALPEAIAFTVDRVLWNQIGEEEAAIRADPYSTGDAELIEVFGRR